MGNIQRAYSAIDISSDKWILTLDYKELLKLTEPPSLADGLDLEMEKELRLLGCELIQSGAILLKLPQTAAATGQILFQRYYYQKSFVRYNMLHTVMACLLLASRIEEAPRRPRDVINVINRLQQLHTRRNLEDPRSNLTPLKVDKNYSDLKNTVIKAERRILTVLGFVVHVNHPHKLIYAYMHVLKLLDRKDILYKAWNYMNDGLRTDIFLRHPSETIACACIFLAARTVENPVALPNEPRPWFELFDSSEEDVHSIAMVLTKLYTIPKIPDLTRLYSHVEKLFKAKYEVSKPEPPKALKIEKKDDRPKIRSRRSRSRSRDKLNRSRSRRSRSRSRKSRHRSRSRDRSHKR